MICRPTKRGAGPRDGLRAGQVRPHRRGHRLHRAQHRHEARGGGDPVQDVLAKAPGRQDLQEELPHDDERMLPRSRASNHLLGIMVLRLGVKIL